MPSIKPNKCSCIICHLETSQLGINTHFLRAHTNTERWDAANKLRKDKNSKLIVEKQNDYERAPTKCMNCGNAHEYKQRNHKFCSKSCSATYNNAQRDHEKIKTGPRKFIGPKLPSGENAEFIKSVCGEYCKIYLTKCKYCVDVRYTRSYVTRVCRNCKMTKYRSQDLYRFKFNVYDYPDLFDLVELDKIGWYSQGGKSRKPKNVNGYSRDHRVSQYEARINNYDHYYISHPINCELLLQTDNSKKHKSSSISYDELVKQVIAYDNSKKLPTTELRPPSIWMREKGIEPLTLSL